MQINENEFIYNIENVKLKLYELANTYGYSELQKMVAINNKDNTENLLSTDISDIINYSIDTFINDKMNISCVFKFDNKFVGIVKKPVFNNIKDGNNNDKLMSEINNFKNKSEIMDKVKELNDYYSSIDCLKIILSDNINFGNNVEINVQDEFTLEEQELLSQYITNINSDIYCFKNLPEEVIAVLLSYVSRSPNTFKRNLINLLKDDELNINKINPDVLDDLKELISIASNHFNTESFKTDINEIPNLLINNTSNFNNSSEKASKFHEKYILGYGHASCAELANIKGGIDKISILATKELEDNRLGSYIEKSTRYQQFTNSSYFIPDLPEEFVTPYCDYMDYLFETYNGLFDLVQKELMNLYPKKDEQKEKPWLNSIKAKACDILRYLLPTSTYTSMGFSFNARVMENTLTKLMSHPLTEVKELGYNLKTEALKICPTLVKYANYNSNLKHSFYSLKSPAEKFYDNQSITDFLPELKDQKVKLTSNISYQQLLNTLFCYLYYSHSDLSFEELMTYANKLSSNYKIKTIEEACQFRENHESLNRAFESVNVNIDIISDYGAYRDLHRHRMMTQFKQQLTPYLGFSCHPDLLKMPNDIIDLYNEALMQGYILYNSFKMKLVEKNITDEYNLQYILPMAYNIQYNYVINLRQLINMIELRHKSQGHYAYRKLSIMMYDQLIDKYPVLKNIIKIKDKLDNANLERLNSENKNYRG